MPSDSKLDQLLGSIFDGAREGLREELEAGVYQDQKRDFIFHMSDWRDDLARLATLFGQPDRQDEDSASELVIGFLYHVIPHLNAAGRLLLDEVKDPFAKSSNPC